MLIKQEDIIKILNELQNTEKMKTIQIGLFGSYARGQQTDTSDIDIVLKGKAPLFLVTDGYELYIKKFIKKKLNKDCDVIDYADLIVDYQIAMEDGFEKFCMKSIVDKEVIMLESEH